MLKLMLITNEPQLARFAVEHGVERIFVDLEIHGKRERQGHRDTLISSHSMADVAKVRAAIGDAQLLVRVNPLYAGSVDEVEGAIAAGADLLMLPMFDTPDQVEQFVALVGGRAKVMPLVETPSALDSFAEILAVPGVSEIYLGLNDLHMALGMSFMFEPVANGMVERAAALARANDIPFGFGGIARMHEGMLPGEMVLAEHLRLGSSSVILSRTFHRNSQSLDELKLAMNFAEEVQRLRMEETRLALRDEAQIESDHRHLVEKIAEVTALLAARAKK